jgi:hypothetical protein
MKKSQERLDALNAITDKVLAYRPEKKQKAAGKRTQLPIVAAGISVARVKEARNDVVKFRRTNISVLFSPSPPLT